MITIVCGACNMALRVSGEVEEMDSLFGEKSDWYPDKFPCPSCDGKGEVLDAISDAALRVLDVHDVTPMEAYAALNGLGLPEEQDCGPTAVQQAFKKPVARIGCRLIKGTNRSVLDYVEFEDESRLYLGASAYGAIVYRIAPKRSFVEEQDAG